MGALQHTEHRHVVAAPAGTLFGVVSDVELWPAVFGPTVHVTVLERGVTSERFRIWAVVGENVVDWVSRREHDPAGLSVTFEQERSSPPVAEMGGEWRLRPMSDGRTEVVLLHHYRLVDDDPAAAARIAEAVETNSRRELEALAAVAEQSPDLSESVFTFEDRHTSAGRVEDCYEFVDRADLWPQRLPHVASAVLGHPGPDVQDLRMVTMTADGSEHSTRSYRVCRPERWIAYKQLRLPELLRGHSGVWEFAAEGDRTAVTSRHTVAIDAAAVERVLGAGSTLADAGEFVRAALGGNSRTTLEHACAFARDRAREAARP